MLNQSFKKVLFASLTLLFLACSVFIPKPIIPPPSTADIEREEQAVYSFFASRDLVLILQDTATTVSDNDLQQTMDYVKSGLKGISNETISSYLNRNKGSSQLSPDMDLGVSYTLISPDELKRSRASQIGEKFSMRNIPARMVI